MFDFDASKLFVIGIVALIVIGPKELPRVLRQIGVAVGKMRRMAGEFQSQFMDAMKESEIEELKKDMKSMADSARVDVDLESVHKANAEMKAAIEGTPATAATEAEAAKVTSLDVPALPDTPAPDSHTILGAGIGPVADATPAEEAALAEATPAAPTAAPTLAPAQQAGKA